MHGLPPPQIVRFDGSGSELGQGAQAIVYRRGDGLIEKVFRTRVLDDAVRREFDHSLRAYQAGVPTWKVERLILDGDTRSIVGSFEGGLRLSQTVRRRPHHGLRLMATLGGLHARIHAVVADEAPPCWRPDVGATLDGLKPYLPADRIEEIEALLANPEIGFCHGDLSLTNVLCNDGKLVAIDWARSGHGALCADVGRTAAFILNWRVGGPAAAGMAYKKRLALAYLDAYGAATGRSQDEMRAWTCAYLLRKLERPHGAAARAALEAALRQFGAAANVSQTSAFGPAFTAHAFGFGLSVSAFTAKIASWTA